MKQPLPKTVKQTKVKTKKQPKNNNLDGSGLETYFKINFLDKLDLKYEQQYEAKPIGRFYDFKIKNIRILIEVDGGYYHVDPRLCEGKKLRPLQKRNIRVDELKNKWALLNGYILLRFWEYDIYNNPQMIMETLEKHVGIATKKMYLNEKKKDGSFYNINI